LQDNEWRRIIGFLTGIVDSKLGREEMESLSQSMEMKLRCFARRLSSFQRRLEGEAMDPAAGTKKARCLSCDRVVRYEREYVSTVIMSDNNRVFHRRLYLHFYTGDFSFFRNLTCILDHVRLTMSCTVACPVLCVVEACDDGG
jgi:hypothetical protein